MNDRKTNGHWQADSHSQVALAVVKSITDELEGRNNALLQQFPMKEKNLRKLALQRLSAV